MNQALNDRERELLEHVRCASIDRLVDSFLLLAADKQTGVSSARLAALTGVNERLIRHSIHRLALLGRVEKCRKGKQALYRAMSSASVHKVGADAPAVSGSGPAVAEDRSTDTGSPAASPEGMTSTAPPAQEVQQDAPDRKADLSDDEIAYQLFGGGDAD